MKVNINLLPEKAKLKFARFRKSSQIRIILVLTAIIFFLFSAFVLTYNIRFKEENASLKLRLEAAEKRVESKREMELQAFLLKERVGQINAILEKRRSLNQTLWEIFSLLPPQASIQQVEANDQAIKIVFGAPTHLEASNFIDNFPREEIDKLGGKTVNLSSVTRDEEGSYTVDFKIDF